MARYITNSTARVPLAWSCRTYTTSASSPAVEAGLADLEYTPLETSGKPDESLIESFEQRKTKLKAQRLPGNR